MIILKSPLTNSTDITLLKTIASNKLIDNWHHAFDIDITEEMKGNKEIYLYECNKTKLKFFLPIDIAGSEKLYEQLQKFDWFYMSEKWEHKIALKYLSNFNNVLEVGCAFGSFVESALKSGFNAQGIELNLSAVEVAKKNNLPVENVDLEEFAYKYPLSQDAICSFQVLEHIPQPKNFIELCLKTLKPGGKLIFCVPNAESFLKYQYNLLDMPPHHMTQWTAATFKSLENIFPVKLEKVLKEPLADYHIHGYLYSYCNHIRSISPLGKLIYNKYTLPLYQYLLKSGLRNFITGQSIYVEFRKLDEIS
ncbi:MAG: class I SAM-dependent methyltransferase [Aphanizomenon flos-aquae KM1D3_PB]|nr:MAG: class I SAM-dependent methyltransferase [Aphanizomenon flos-aquae KM1D3_PB]